MTPLSLLLGLSLQASPATSAAPAPSASMSDAHRLPLQTLVLYENGLGYFERKGNLPGGATAEIPLEPGQLDDALKSMVVLSDQGVASVEYAPPLAEAAARDLAAMPSNEDQRSLESVIRSLKGVEVKVIASSGAKAQGRVLEISDDQDERDKEGHPLPTPTLMLFGEAGLSRLRLKEIVSMRPTDPKVQLAWDRALQSDAAQPNRQTLKVRGAHAGGSVAVGYTTEAAVWRTTYRLVLEGRAKSSARLQGFGLVHNDSDEAWEGVKVSLVSGHPTSFLFPLAGPRYGRREMVDPQDGLDVAPQLTTQQAREHLQGPHETISLGGIGTVGYGSGSGVGYGAGAVGGSVHGSVIGSGESPTVLEGGPTPLEPAAVSEAGELFLYHVKEPVYLAPRRSALLPIIDTAVTAEPITLIDAKGTRLGVRLTNDTALTLEEGTLSVFTDGAYAGEVQVDRVKPKEVRVLAHGDDLDLEATATHRRDNGPARKAKVLGQGDTAALEVSRLDTLTHHLVLESRSDRPRRVLVELPEHGFKVVSGVDEDVRSPGQPRYARLELKPHEKKELDVVEEGAFKEVVGLQGLDLPRLDRLLTGAVPDDAKKLLLALRTEVIRRDEAHTRTAETQAQAAELEKDLARVRDNLAAAGKGGATKAAEALGDQLLKGEQQLAKFKSRLKDLAAAEEVAKKALVVAAGAAPNLAQR